MYNWPYLHDDIPVLTELPDGVQETKLSSFRMAFGNQKYYHYCSQCGGWLEGEPIQFREDTSGPLCGRKGEVVQCIRLGHEIAFLECVINEIL